MPDRPASRVELQVLGARGFEYAPLGDASVIRFRLTADDWIDVRLRGDALELYHDGSSRNRIAVRPEVANVISVVLVPKD